MKSIAYGALLALSLISTACGIFSPNLARRYRNKSNNIFENAKNPSSFVKVELNTSIIREAPIVVPVYNLLSLSPEGQAELIKSLDGNTTTLKDMVDHINTNFTFNKETKQNIRIIPKKIKKALVFTVNRHFYSSGPGSVTFNSMGDRVAYLKLSTTISKGSNAVFDSWDRFVSDHLTLDLGKVTSAQQWNAALNLNAKTGAEMTLSGNNATENLLSDKQGTIATLVGPSGAGTSTVVGSNEFLSTAKENNSAGNNSKAYAEYGLGGSLSFTDRNETALDLKNRILKLSGTLTEDNVVLVQEGGQGFDLSGNVVVSVDYLIKDDWAPPVRFNKFKELYSAGTPVPVSRLIDNFATVVFPDIKSDITGSIGYDFLYRQVNKGNRHLPEARQKVTYWHGEVKPDQRQATILIKKNDIRPKAYRLTVSQNSILINGKSIQFETASDAANFYHYLGALLASPASDVSSILVSGERLNSSNYKDIIFETIDL